MSYFTKLPRYSFLTGLSCTIGLLIPTIYEFGQEPAARSRHYATERAAMLVMLLTIVACSLLMWFRRRQLAKGKVASDEPYESTASQFGLRELFGATTIAAVVLAITSARIEMANVLVAAVAVAVVVWAFLKGDWRVRKRVIALQANMFLPFTWAIAYSRPFGSTSGLVENILIFAGIILAELSRALIGFERDGATQLAAVIVTVELLFGAWLARGRPVAFGIYLCLMILLSCFSSFGLHALFRA